MPAFEHLGQTLRLLRRARGWTQQQTGDAAQMTKAMISAYETERQRPTVETLDRLLHTFEIDLLQLYAMMAAFDRHPGSRPSLKFVRDVQRGLRHRLPARPLPTTELPQATALHELLAQMAHALNYDPPP